MKTDLEIMCDRLAKGNKCCEKNEIVCVKRYLEEYAHGDINKILKVKADVLKYDYKNFFTWILSLCAFAISCLSLLRSIVGKDNNFNILLLGILLYALLYIIYVKYKFRNIREWQSYILVVVDKMLDDYNKK